MWKKKTPAPTLPTSPVDYPSGIAVRTETAVYLIHKDGKRYRIASQSILESWNFPFVVNSTEAALARYPKSISKLGFRDGTLLNNIADGKMYLVSDSKLRHIVHPDVLTRLGVTKDDAVLVSAADIKIMKPGEEIT